MVRCAKVGTFRAGVQTVPMPGRQIGDSKRLQAETRKELDALMPSILARAFKGEL